MNKEKQPSSHKFSPKQRLLITIGIVLAIILIPYGIAEFNYQMKINKLSSEVDKIGQDVVKSASGVAVWSNTSCPFYFDSVGWVDAGPCPMSNRGWVVLVEPNMEAGFISNVLNKEGYTQGVTSQVFTEEVEGGGTKSGIRIKLGLSPITSQQLPYTAPEGKAWRMLSASAYYN